MRIYRAHRPRRFIPRLEELELRAVPSASGLLDFQAQPAGRVPPVQNNTQIVGDTPSQIVHAYGFDQIAFLSGQPSNSAGSGQTIAIVDVYDDPNILSDANHFSSTFGLPQFNNGPGTPTFTKVNENGSSTGPFPNSNASWAGEISLDVEWAHAIAPSANILLVEANSTYLNDLLPAINAARNGTGVSAVSMSWGGTEFKGISADDSYLTTPSGHSGVTFTAATLDNGAYYKGFTAAYWPAASPNVLAVGGTVLTLNGGNYSSESGWQYGGGGLSKYETQPSYQTGVVTQSSTQRANPDVSYAAGAPGFAIYDTVTYNGQIGWFAAQGTSAGTPQWAALAAIANQGRAQLGLTPLDGPSQVLPTLYGLANNSADFHDITTGKNGYSAATGYDLVTGLGTPQAAAIIQSLLTLPSYLGSSSTTGSSATGSANVGAAANILPQITDVVVDVPLPQDVAVPGSVAVVFPTPAAPKSVAPLPSLVPTTSGPAAYSLADLVPGSGHHDDTDEGLDNSGTST